MKWSLTTYIIIYKPFTHHYSCLCVYFGGTANNTVCTELLYQTFNLEFLDHILYSHMVHPALFYQAYIILLSAYTQHAAGHLK